jgi:hypothetical protein
MGGVGRGGWGVGVVLAPTIWPSERSTLELSESKAIHLERTVRATNSSRR